MHIVKWVIGTVFSLILLAGVAFFSLHSWLDVEKVRQFATEAIAKETGRHLTVSGELKTMLSLSPTISASAVTLSNPEWAKHSDMIKADQLVISFRILPLLQGQFAIDAIELHNAIIALEEKETQTSWSFETEPSHVDATNDTASESAAENMADTSDTFSIGQLSVHNSTIHYINHHDSHDYTVEITSATLNNISKHSIDAIIVDASYLKNNLSVNGRMAEGVFHGTVNILNMAGVNASLDGFFNLDQQIFDLAIEAATVSLDALGHAIDTDISGKEPVTFHSKAKGSTKTFTLSDLSFGYDTYQFSGNADITLKNTLPYVNAILHADALSFTGESTTPVTQETGTVVTVNETATTPVDAPDLAWMHTLNADLVVSANAVHLDKTKLGRSDATISLKDGTLIVKPFKADTSQGSLTGEAQLNATAQPATLATTLYANDLVVEKLAETIGHPLPVSKGHLKGMLHLNGPFTNTDTYLSSSDGTIKLYLDQLTYHVDQKIDKAAQFISVLQGKDDVDTSSLGVQCLVADFDVKQGTAHTKSLAMKTDGAIVKGSGDIHLSDLNSDLTLKARSHFLGVVDVVPALKLTGPIDSPSVTLDAGHAVIGIGKLVLGATTGIGLAAVLGEQVTDRLGITEDNNPCLKSIAEFEQKLDAAPKQTPKQVYKNAEDNFRATRDTIKQNVKRDLKSGKAAVKQVKEDLENFKKGLKNFIQ